MQPVILAGGFGTRLWPSSREFLPKQFVNLFLGQNTLFQESVKRMRMLCPDKKILIIGNKIHLYILKDQLRQINEKNYTICLEPESRNTFPATLLASCFFDEDDVIFIAPSDHLIGYSEGSREFEYDVIAACKYAKINEKIVVFGVKPTSAETGYGYIKQGIDSSDNIFSVQSFTEKPNLEKAEGYLKSGDYYWNSGMFAISISGFLKDTKAFENDSYLASVELKDDILSLALSGDDIDVVEVGEKVFSKMRKESIDYAIIEKSKRVAMIESGFSWDDLGDWKSIADNSKCNDENGNTVSKNVISLSNKDCYIANNGNTKIAIVGLENIIVVAENDSILIMDKSCAQKVKEVVSELKKESVDYLRHPTFENRPWGNFNTIFQSKNTKIKKLVIKPSKRLSLQSHNYRSEHWIVTQGTASVILNEKEIEVNQNESIFIPINAVHRIENKQDFDLIIIEVQIGDYLGEDDIKRYNDDWGRN